MSSGMSSRVDQLTVLTTGGRSAQPEVMRPRGRERLSIRAYLVLRSVMVFDAILLLAVAVLLWAFMQHPAGVVGGGLCCLLAGLSLGAAGRLDVWYDQSG